MSRLPHATGCRVVPYPLVPRLLAIACPAVEVRFLDVGHAALALTVWPPDRVGRAEEFIDVGLRAMVRAALGDEDTPKAHPAALLDYVAEFPERCPGVSAEAVAALHREGW